MGSGRKVEGADRQDGRAGRREGASGGDKGASSSRATQEPAVALTSGRCSSTRDWEGPGADSPECVHSGSAEQLT